MPLAPLLVLTDRQQAEPTGRTLVETVAAAIDGGARAVLFREKDLPRHERLPSAAAIATRLAEVGGELVVASDVDLARSVDAFAVHLAATDEWPDDTGDLFVGCSCHDRFEVERAAQRGAEYVTVSPVFPTESKPDYGPALGPDGFAEACDVPGAPPVYALGGITPGVVPFCMNAGAWGIAVMGLVMRARDPAAIVDKLLHALA